MHRRAALAALLAVGLVGLVAPGAAHAAGDELRAAQWGLDRIGAERAWSTGARGAGVTIAVVDTGVDLDHPDLAGKVLPGRDFVDDDDVAQDEEGHGTHVAGIAAAVAGNGTGIAGVAPEARILPVRVLDEEGSGSGADVAAGIRWATARGADVINLSLGEDTQAVFGPSFADAVEEAWAAGAVCVVAAGNDFVLSSGFGDQPAVVVSATDRGDGAPLYSNGVGSARWGVAAPGGAAFGAAEDDILSTYLDDTYGYLAGTSMAAPHVSGALAVLLGRGLSPQEAVDRLLATATDVGPKGRDATYGAGRIDLAAAVGAPVAPAAAAPGPARPPTTAAPAPAPSTPPATAAPAPPTSAGSAGSSAPALPGVRPVAVAPGPVAPEPTTSPADETVVGPPPPDGSTGEASAELALEGVDVSKPLEDVPGADGGSSSNDDEDVTVPAVVAGVLLALAFGATGVMARRLRSRRPAATTG